MSSQEYYVTQGGTAGAFVSGLYADLFGRAPDPGGLGFWTTATSTLGAAGVASAFVASAEYGSRLISSWYQDYLGRPVDAGGLNFWLTERGRGFSQPYGSKRSRSRSKLSDIDANGTSASSISRGAGASPL